MLTLQSSKYRIVCLLIFKVNQDSLGDVILLTSQGVSFTEVQERLIVRRGVSALHLLVSESLNMEVFPENWNQAVVTPVLKKDDL